jgi:phytoene dehydrogenase-like protein
MIVVSQKAARLRSEAGPPISLSPGETTMLATAKAPRREAAPKGVPEKRSWDVVCIGSGMGSLAAAAALARTGRSVLVLEAHTQIGGLTHTFARKGVRWGTGLHYTGWSCEHLREFPLLWDTLTGGQAPWMRLPEDTDHYLHPDGVFVKRAPRQRFREDLHAAFPAERAVIDRYLDDLGRVVGDLFRFVPLQSLPRWVERLGLGWWLGRRFLAADRLPLVRYMDQIGASPQLRRHLWFAWGNFGGIPAETSFASHAIPTESLLDGLWTSRHGSQSVAEAFTQTIRRAGGEVRRGAPVSGLVFQGGRVVGVRVGEEEVRAGTVLSGIGARETYRLLVPPDRRPRHADSILSMKASCSMFTLYLALDRAVLRRFGLTGVNYWVESERGGIDDVWTDLNARPPWFVLSLAARFPHETAESEAEGEETIPAEVFIPISGERFRRWQETRVMKRGEEYSDFKGFLKDQALRRLDETWPGFGGFVRYVEGATPLSIRSFTGHDEGAAYGLAPVPGRYSNRALRAATGVPGLLLTGQDVGTAGVIGAFYGGLIAASAVLCRDARPALLR